MAGGTIVCTQMRITLRISLVTMVAKPTQAAYARSGCSSARLHQAGGGLRTPFSEAVARAIRSACLCRGRIPLLLHKPHEDFLQSVGLVAQAMHFDPRGGQPGEGLTDVLATVYVELERGGVYASQAVIAQVGNLVHGAGQFKHEGLDAQAREQFAHLALLGNLAMLDDGNASA